MKNKTINTDLIHSIKKFWNYVLEKHKKYKEHICIKK